MAQRVKDVMTPGAVTCGIRDTAADAARVMKQAAIGDVLVLDSGRLCGMVTDRDIVVRVIAEGRDPEATPLGEICSDDVVTVRPNDDATYVVRLMTERAVRRIPIVDGDKIVGIVTMGDLAIERAERSALAAVSAAPPNG
ncbi:MAG TPA: CBS domain-containing protein [Jatrophihabitans sp.]|nr:CBS domain-containing protein [Jatrophihabitans sp.]